MVTINGAKKQLEEIARTRRLALKEQYKISKPNHVWSVNARIKVAVVTLMQAAFGVCGNSSPACWFSCPGSTREQPAHGAGGSLGWLRLPEAALLPKLEGKRLSQGRRGCRPKKCFWGEEKWRHHSGGWDRSTGQPPPPSHTPTLLATCTGIHMSKGVLRC